MNKTYRKIAFSITLLLTLSLAVGGTYFVSAETDEEDAHSVSPSGIIRRGFGVPMHGIIDEELRQELHDSVQALRDEDATPQEIREFIQGFLEENSVDFQRPEISEEQLEAYRKLHENVKTYAIQRVSELGVDLPENGFFRHRDFKFRDFMRSCLPGEES